MEKVQKEFIDALIESEKRWKGADYLVNVTFRVVKDPKLLVKALEGLHGFFFSAITSVLKFEYLYKRIELGEDKEKNLEMFFRRCASRYGLTREEGEMVREVLILGEKHKESGIEFSKNEKLIILDDDLGKSELDFDKMKRFLEIGSKLLEHSNKNFKKFL